MSIKPPATIAAIIAAVIFTAFKTNNNGKIERDLDAHELIGKVKWCKSNTRSVGLNGKTIVTDKEDFYNTDGNVVREFYTYVPMGKHRKHTDTAIVTYDAGGRKLSEDENTQHVKTTHAYHYNENHMLVEAWSINDDCPSFITYNAKGYRDNYLDYSIYGKFIFKEVYGYDAADNNTEETRYWANGGIDSKKIRVFNEKHQLISETEYKEGRELRSKKTFNYDEQGRKIMEIDSALRMLRGVSSTGKKSDIPSDIDTYTYQYIGADKGGNWLQKITFFNGKKQEDIKREIAYYE